MSLLDLSNLTKTKEQRELMEIEEHTNRIAKEMFLDLIGKQLTYQESQIVLHKIQETLVTWGRNWLDHQFVNHVKNDLEEQGKLK